ncbi:MAG: polysaccharide biosynthesis tyrosine autokinase, partial [Candidatus Sumerlaeota bacterium]
MDPRKALLTGRNTERPLTKAVRGPVNTMVKTSAGDTAEASIDPYYFRLLWQRRWLIVTCVVIFLAFGAFQVRRTVPVYTSVAVIKYEPSGARVVDFGERSSILYQRDEIKTAVELIQSPAIAKKVIYELNLNKLEVQSQTPSPMESLRNFFRDRMLDMRDLIVSYKQPDLDPEIASEQSQTAALLKRLDVVQRIETKLVEISVRSNDPKRAKLIVDTFCDKFIEYMTEDKKQRFGYARSYLNDQVDIYKKKLQSSEKALFDLSNQSDLTVMDDTRRIAIETLTTLTSEIESMKNERALLEAEDKANETGVSRLADLEKSSELFKNLANKKSELIIAQIQMASQNEPGYQPLILLDRAIESIDQQIKQAVEEQSATTKGKLVITQEKLESLQKRLKEQQENVNEIEKQMIPYREAQREIDSTKSIFNSLLMQYNQLEVSDDIKPDNVTIVSRGDIPTYPTSPNVTRMLGLFALFGLFIGSGIVLGLNWLDRSVKNPAIIEAMLNLASLGFIPFMKTTRNGGFFKTARSGRSVVLLDPHSKKPDAEAFRYLRTSIQYSSAEHPPQVMLITSCFPQEGKSTVSSNLAIFFAERGQKTIIVDADLKRPNVHKVFEVSRMPGVSDVLTGQCELEAAILQSKVENLHILPAGLSTPSPITLLESQAMADLIASLRTRYTTIILDS